MNSYIDADYSTDIVDEREIVVGSDNVYYYENLCEENKWNISVLTQPETNEA